ncbi:MAG: hypothetical protein JSV19_11075 [Phycisphaerales bacterium]|nr:MAG: hypothetical protein JSV19_11075 [Phycisphaerales bacterium]
MRQLPDSYGDADRPARWGIGLADGVALLAGVGIQWSALGFSEQLYRVLDPTPLTGRLVWGAVFASLAVGLALPPTVALWIGRQGWRRRGSSRWSTAWSPPGDDIDLSLFWTVLAGLALLTGVLVAAGPMVVLALQHIYESLLHRFVWVSASLTAVEGVLVFAGALVLFAPAGWVMSCVHSLADPTGRWSVRPLGWALVGCAVSGLALVALRAWFPPPVMMMVLGGMPFLVVAIVAVRRSHVHDMDRELPGAGPAAPPPDERDPWPAVLRAAVVGAAAAGVAAAVWWSRAFSILGGLDSGGTLTVFVVAGLAFGVGVLAACRPGRGRIESIGGFGTLCATGGVVLGAALVWAALFPRCAGFDAAGGTVFWVTVSACVGIPSVVIGYAVAYGHQSVLRRVGSKAVAGASMLSLSLAGVSAAFLFVLAPTVVALGTYASIAAAALTLVALGGVLVIHEPTYPRGVRHVRVAAVFAAVGVLAVALPAPARAWLLTREGTRVRLIESQWLTHSQWQAESGLLTRTEPPPRGHVVAARYPCCRTGEPLLDLAAVTPNRRAVFLGQTSAGVRSATGIDVADCESHAFDPSMAVRPRRNAGSAAHHFGMTATRVLRLRRGQLDVVLMSLDGLSRFVRDQLLATGTLDRARSSLTPDGMVALLLPTHSFETEELERWIERVACMTDSQFVWTCLQGQETPVLVLVFGRDGAWRARWSRWSACRVRQPAELPHPTPDR